MEHRFYCENSHEWLPVILCDDKSDLIHHESKLWAFIKPSIPQPPLWWELLLKIKAKGGSKFVDMYVLHIFQLPITIAN